MSFRLKPHLIGAVSDAIELRLSYLTELAVDAGAGNRIDTASIRAELIHEDMGCPSEEEMVRLGLAHEIATATFADWWRRGRRVVEAGECDAIELDAGAYFMPLDQTASSYFHPEMGMLEGAFILNEARGGHWRLAMTLLFANDLDRDLCRMPLEKLFKHQAGIVVTNWNCSRQCSEVAFIGSGVVFDDPAAILALEAAWAAIGQTPNTDGPVPPCNKPASVESQLRF